MSVEIYRHHGTVRLIATSDEGDVVQVTIDVEENRCGIVVLPKRYPDMSSEGVMLTEDALQMAMVINQELGNR
jgi:hypothetical protein